MDGVVDKNDVLITINKVHDRFSGVTAKRGRGKKREHVLLASMKYRTIYCTVSKETKISDE